MEVNVGEMRDAAIGRRGRGMHIVAKCGDGIVDRLGVVLLQSLQQRGDIVVEVAAAVRVVVVGIVGLRAAATRAVSTSSRGGACACARTSRTCTVRSTGSTSTAANSAAWLRMYSRDSFVP